MAIRKKNKRRKGLRIININGNEYYWKVENNKKFEIIKGNMQVVIGKTDAPHKRVIVKGRGLYSCIELPGCKIRFIHSLVTPKLIREAILFALEKGWTIESKKSQINIIYEQNEFIIP